MSQPVSQPNPIIISYLQLRTIIGWIGTLLPIVLIGGGLLFFTASLPDSMSGYYYTPMRNVLVGALCAIGVFLVRYDGYDDLDRWITDVAGLGAIAVAFFPTKPSAIRLSVGQQVIGDLHVFFAAVTFIALGVMALRFAKSAGTPTPRKRERNVIYRVCGITILSCVVLAALSTWLPASGVPWLFLFEALAVLAFGISWFVKGQALPFLKDHHD